MSFHVYRSSAGSGKTYTLVKAYLRIALSTKQVDTYRHILAITFTNKAANEMKERVVRALQALGGSTAPTGSMAILSEQLCEELELPEEVINERAANVLEHLLHHYSDFSVSTIDKFVHRVVRTFAHDLNIPYNFDVELDESNLLQKAIDLLISRIGEDPQLTRALVEFTESKTEDEKSWHIESDLYKFARNLLTETSHSYLEKIRGLTIEDFFRLRDDLQENISEFETTLKELGTEALDLIDAAEIPFAAFAGGARSGIPAYFQRLKSVRVDKLEPSDKLLRDVEENKWFSTKSTLAERNAIEAIQADLHRLFRDALDHLGSGLPEYQLYKLIHRNVYALAVLNELEKIIEAFKAENNLLHISEFNKRIAEIVAWEPAPFIYERLGERYRNYLIDEFQDTSVLQWQNLLPLVENALSSGHFNLVVGDGKQSIYRWRGGEVEQFEQLPEVINPTENPLVEERVRVLRQHFQEERLDTNYRSRQEVVEFNNFFFARLSERLIEDYRGIYADVAQEFRPDHTGGLVQVDVLTPEEDEDEQAQMFDHILRCVETCRADGYALSDITVLCRRNNEASLIAQFLLANGLDVISSESLMLANSEKVRFLIAFIRYLSDPQNRIYRAGLLIQSGKSGVLKKDLHPFLTQLNSEGSAFSFAAFFAGQGYEIDPVRMAQLPLYEAVEELVSRFDLNSPPSPYMNYFLDFVFSYTARNHDNLGEFLEKWEEKKGKLSIVIPEGIEAVRIMTIHKSKGLEFPVVIFPFANWMVKPARTDLWVDLPPEQLGLPSALVPTSKQLEQTVFSPLYDEEHAKSLLDNFNVLYVACTRPVDRLYMLTSEPGRFHNLSSFFLPFLKDGEGWNEDEARYTHGSAQPLEQETKTEVESDALDKLISHNWRSKVSISLKAPELWDPEHTDTPGLLPLLQTAFLNLESKAGISDTVRHMHLEGLLTQAEAEAIEDRMQTILDDEEIAAFFEPNLEVRFDTEVILPDGESYQPDRLVVQAGKAVLLTYLITEPTDTQRSQLFWGRKLLQEMGLPVEDLHFLDLEKGQLKPVRSSAGDQLELVL